MTKQLYSIHIEFSDGSNPYYKLNMTRNQYGLEIKKWCRNYSLKMLNFDKKENGDCIIYFKAWQEKDGRGQNKPLDD